MFELTPFDRRHRRDFYNPFRMMENFEKNFWGGNGLTDFKTDIRDQGDSYLLEAELPGFQKEELNVEIDGNYLTISAERHSESEEKDEQGNYLRRERSYGSFSRSFDISNVKADQISAAYDNGVLKLTMPKKDGTVPNSRRLDIK